MPGFRSRTFRALFVIMLLNLPTESKRGAGFVQTLFGIVLAVGLTTILGWKVFASAPSAFPIHFDAKRTALHSGG